MDRRLHWLALVASIALVASGAPVHAATITITSVTNNSTCVTADANNGNDLEEAYGTGNQACSEQALPGLGDGNFMRVTDSGTTASSAGAGSSTSIDFDIDGGVAADALLQFGGDEFERGKVRYTVNVDVTALIVEDWTVDLAQEIRGLFGHAGDGAATAVGTQDNGLVDISVIDVDVDATDYSFSATPASNAANPSNNSTSSTAFLGTRSDTTVASGSGNGSFVVTVAFDMDAFSDSGCSGFICSSASGGEDAAVLLGYDNVDDCCGGTSDRIIADDYATWGRAVGPDGYNSTWTLNVTSLCGDGVIDGGAGETCDEGASNGASDSCCTNICQLRTSGDVCRPNADFCDVQETCDGVSPTCPADSFEPPTVVCRAASSGEVCDVDEFCTGGGATCPSDAVEPSGTVCRTAVFGCDAEETCDGVTKICPADVIAGAGTECRAVAGICDVAEVCDGIVITCPPDSFGSGAECRASAGVCDVAESCNGAGPNCPADGFDTGTECRGSAGVCDVAESCNGTGPNCPADGFDTGTQCRTSAGVCDAAETCDGGGINCPADGFDTGSVCRADTGQCDVAETCDGGGINCPADGFEPDGTSCDDGSASTVADQCTAGVCDGTPLSGNLDAFKCYKARDLKNPKFVKTTIVSLDDQFQNETNAQVKRPFLHCNPTDVNGGGIFNAADHLVCYKAKPEKFAVRPRVEVSNIFGTIQLEAKKSFLMCFPSSKTILP